MHPEEEYIIEEKIHNELTKPKSKKMRWFFFIGGIIVLAISGTLFFKTSSTFSEVFVRDFLSFMGGGKLPNETNFELHRDKDRINILLLGIRGANDPGNGKLLADSILILSIKKDTGQIGLLSLPRDLYVAMPNQEGMQKINFSYALGEEKQWDGGGLMYSKKVVAYVSGLYIDYAASVDFSGFKKIIDEVGGVTITLNNDFVEKFQWVNEGREDSPFWNPTDEGWEFRVPAGRHTLNGEEALYFVRSRYSTNDFDRMKRQQKVLFSLKDKILSLGFLANPLKIYNLLDVVGNSVKTDISLNELKEIIYFVGNSDINNIKHQIFDTTPEGLLYSTKINGMYVLLPNGDNYDQIRNACINIFAN